MVIAMLDIKTTMNRKSIPKDLKVVYLKADISLREESELRPPIDLYVILDISKSMEKHKKLEYAKRAIIGIFDMLNQYDRLNVIAFSRYPKLLGENMNRFDKEPFYENVLQDLYASGNTILSRALKMTREVMKEKSLNSSTDFIKKVILISDGNPTEKNNKMDDFIQYIFDEYSSDCSFLGIGIGPDYNEELLRGMAEVTGGAWIHISTDENMAMHIDNEIRNMLNSSIYPIKMSFFPSENVEIERAYTHKPYVFNLDYFRINGRREWGYNFILPSLGNEKEVNLLMKLRLNPEMEGAMRIGEISFFDHQNREHSQKISIEVISRDAGEEHPEVRETFLITETMHSASKSLENVEKIDEIERKTRIFLSKPESRENYGDELGKIMTAVQIAKTGDMSKEEKKKTKIILTKTDE